MGSENKTKPKLRDSRVLPREATHVGQRVTGGASGSHILSIRDYLIHWDDDPLLRDPKPPNP